MDAKGVNIFDLIGKVDHRFFVPVFQRNYSWEKPQWARLWEDIYHIAQASEDKTHFIGSIIWLANSQSAKNQPNMLVDGQQRWATLSLIILAFALYAKKNQNKDLPISHELICKKNFLLTPEDGDLRYKLKLTKTDNDVFRALMDQLDSRANTCNETKTLLEQAFNYFQKKLEEMSDPGLIWEGLNKLSIASVELDKKIDDPQMIFETMNFAGKDLTKADLIRNLVLIDLPEKEQTNFYANYWREIEKSLTCEKENIIDKFIFHYLCMKFAPKDIKESQIYQTFKKFKEAQEENHISREKLLQDILFYAKIYAHLNTYKPHPDIRIAGSMTSLNPIMAKSLMPFVMFIFGEWEKNPQNISKEEFLEFIYIIETYLAYRIFCGEQTEGFNKYFPGIIAKFRELFAKGDYNIVKRLMATLEDRKDKTQRFPDKDTAIEKLKSEPFYKTGSIRTKYFLERLENSLHPEYKLDIMKGKYTVEHIMPQNINTSTDWPEMLGEGYEDKYAGYLHRLGNLTLTAHNQELSNSSFSQKKEMYLKYEPIKLSKSVIEQEEWTFKKIEERTDELARKLVSLWERPTLSKEEIKEFSLEQKEGKKSDGITIKDLLKAGILYVGDECEIPAVSIYTGYPCKITEDGYMAFEDGHKEKSPTGAVQYIMKRKGERVKGSYGWDLWRSVRHGKKLIELKELLRK